MVPLLGAQLSVGGCAPIAQKIHIIIAPIGRVHLVFGMRTCLNFN